MSAHVTPVDETSLFFFERRDCDLPYYRNFAFGGGLGRWLVILASVALGAAALMLAQQRFRSGLSAFLPPLLFVAIPLAGLALAFRPKAPLALFRPLQARDFGVILCFFVVNAIVTVALGLLITRLFDTTPNPATQMVAAAQGAERVLFFGWAALQLLGEEVFTILPFLAFLALLTVYLPRKSALAVAALGASVVFALMHLPTYQWNVAQALVGLVPIRLVLLMPFLITRNIWTSTGTHILNDWTIFGLGAWAAAEP